MIGHPARRDPESGPTSTSLSPTSTTAKMESSRPGRTYVPGEIVTGRTLVPGQTAPQPQVQATGGLDKMLEVVGGAPDPASQAFLLVISGTDPGRLHVIDRPEMVIGRSRYADVQVNERALSQQHAKLVRFGEFHRIFDLGSTNGTFVNDRRVQQADLRPGDTVRTGETIFTYMAGGTAESVETTMALPHVASAGPAQSAMGIPPSAVPPGALMRRMPELPVPPRDMVQPYAAHPAVLEIPGPLPAEGGDLLGQIIRIIEFVRRYWLSLLLCTMLGGAGGAATYKFRKPWANAEFEISLVPKVSDNPVTPFPQRSLEFFRNAQQNFLRPTLIHQTLEQLGETDVTPDRIRQIQERMQFQKTSEYMYHGSFSAPTSEEAVAFLDVHLKLYRDAEIEKALAQFSAEAETLEREVNMAQERLDSTEAALTSFKTENSAGLPDHAAEIYRQVIELGAARSSALSEVARAQADITVSKKRLKSEDPLIESHIEESKPYAEGIATARKRLAELRAQGKGEQHPDVVEAKENLVALEALRDEVLENGTTKIVKSKNPLYKGARNSLDEAEAAYRVATSELGRITKDIEKYEELKGKLPRLEAEYAELTRTYEATQKQFEEMSYKLSTTRVQLELERAQASTRYDIITPPNVKPVSRLGTIIKRSMMGAALGLLLGIGLGVIRELRRYVAARMSAVRRR
jgi:uncharacterized protein involved in exopolysaccharide biosynthesis